MSTLAAQQRQLQHAITAGAPADALLRRAPLLRIYQHAYRARLTAALRDNFGVLPQAMGDVAFDALAHAYIAAHPSQHPSIRWFGHRLAEFMEQHSEWVAHPAFTDLARMEWALRNAFDAADAVPLSAASLAGVPPAQWPSLTFTPHPSVQLLALQWAIEPVWRALKALDGDDEPELPEPAAHAHVLLVWRAGLETRWRSLDDRAAQLLRAALAGQTFAELCELAATQVGADDAAATAVGALQGWLADGLLA
jgi:hypothetical protein